MKCISLWQPWATLIAIGAKRIETRSWQTSYRGELLIHAGKKWHGDLVRLVEVEPFRSVLAAAGIQNSDQLPRGAILCRCRLVDCVAIHDRAMFNLSGPVHPLPGLHEAAFGDYTPGRYAWLLEDVRPLPQPIPLRGDQGVFEVPESVLADAAWERLKDEVAAPRVPASPCPRVAPEQPTLFPETRSAIGGGL